MKDFDNFRNNGPPLYHGDLPPGRHPPPGGPRSPFGFPPFFGPPGHFRPPMPMTLESFKELKYFLALMILSENPEGITGYQFQENFGIPRGNVLRTMNTLLEMGHVKTSEIVIKGRAHKFFIITDKGQDYLSDLKEKWGKRFSQMSEMIDPNMMGNMFMKKGFELILSDQIDNMNSKEDAIDFFRGLRSKVNFLQTKTNERLNFLKNCKSELDSMVQTIEKMDKLDLEEVKRRIEEFKNNLDE